MTELTMMMRRNIEAMNNLDSFSVVVVCCSSAKLAEYWQQRLSNGKGSILAKDSVVIAVDEDWPGGAGNALGTLYAFTKAAKIAKEQYSKDLVAELAAGTISVGLYHTAGKGTRLAPLPGAENNNKPGVKLPATITLADGTSSPVTILEGVIKQTGCYAKSRMGRLSVFWGDQVFIPTVPVEYKSSFHADILCTLGPMPDEATWMEKGMDKYGLIALSKSGSGAQVEKVDHATACSLLKDLGEIASVGASLGSFSVSSLLLSTLLSEFSSELDAKKGKLDSDPHWWMPMTLNKAAYQQLMGQKGVAPEESGPHFDRIAAMMVKFTAASEGSDMGLFGPVDVGQGVCWWDYGQLKLYQRNTLLMIEKTDEAGLMRLFLGISDEKLIKDSTVTNTTTDANSCICSSALGSASGSAGFVKNSVLSNVRCKYIEAENCVLVNVTAERIIAKPGTVVYNIASDAAGGLDLAEKQVRCGVFDASGAQVVMCSDLDTDGGKAWDLVLEGNHDSFGGVYKTNASADPSALEKIIQGCHDSTWAKL